MRPPGDAVDVAIVGVGEPVGRALLNLLEERHFAVGQVFGLAAVVDDPDAAPEFHGAPVDLMALADFDFSRVRYVWFTGDPALRVAHGPAALEAGCWVIDATGHGGADPDVPLIPLELGASELETWEERRMVATPHPAALMLASVLKPLDDYCGVVRATSTVLLAVSELGQAAVAELAAQAEALFNQRGMPEQIFPRQIAFNLLPGHPAPDTREGQIAEETRRLLGPSAPELDVSAAWASVFFGHTLQLRVETRDGVTGEQIIETLRKAPGLIVGDGVDADRVPSPVTDALEADGLYVGGLREDASCLNGWVLWIVADNVRTGSALNAIRVAEMHADSQFH